MNRHLKQRVLLAAMLRTQAETLDLIEQHVTARLAPSNAARPLFEHEMQAGIRFADVEEDIDHAVAEATRLLDELHESIRTEIQTRLFGSNREPISPAEAHQVIHELTTGQPEHIRVQEQGATLLMAALLAAVYLGGGRRLLEEADRQGTDVTGLTPAEIPAEAFREQAAAVAQHPWRRITSKVEEELSRQDRIIQDQVTPESVEKLLGGIQINGSTDQARQAIQSSAGRGRVDTVEEHPELEPSQIWASALLDGETCTDCEARDGHEYEDLDQAREDFPLGYNIACHGGPRCRCTLVFLFSPGQ